MGIEMTEPERLTPQQAWEHVRALWPSATHIRQVNGGQCEIEGKGGYQTFTDKVIDWCDLTQWPPPEPAEQWEDAEFPRDCGKNCRYLLSTLSDEYESGKIVGKDGSDPAWVVLDLEQDLLWAFKCQVRVEPKEATGKDCLQVEEGWLPMDSAPKDGKLILLRMGGKRVEGYWSMCGMWVSRGIGKTISWDKANQPTAWRPL
jgi:hypothetical protein